MQNLMLACCHAPPPSTETHLSSSAFSIFSRSKLSTDLNILQGIRHQTIQNGNPLRHSDSDRMATVPRSLWSDSPHSTPYLLYRAALLLKIKTTEVPSIESREDVHGRRNTTVNKTKEVLSSLKTCLKMCF